MAKKQPSSVDAHVGSRVRLRRMLIGMSQEKLGELLGLTFQQVQKYEKGANRIAASRLLEISVALDLSVSQFYEGLSSVRGAKAQDAQRGLVDRMLATPDGRDMARLFVSIESPRLRRRIVGLAQALAEEEAG